MRANTPLTTNATPTRPMTMPAGSSTIVTPIARPMMIKHEPQTDGSHMTEEMARHCEKVPEGDGRESAIGMPSPSFTEEER
jgi:hypothetical protein